VTGKGEKRKSLFTQTEAARNGYAISVVTVYGFSPRHSRGKKTYRKKEAQGKTADVVTEEDATLEERMKRVRIYAVRQRKKRRGEQSIADAVHAVGR